MKVDFTTPDKKLKLPINYEKVRWQVRRQAREQYVDEQRGKCYWCEAPLEDGPPKKITDLKISWALFPHNFLEHPVHLQHNHITGMTEGAVHAYCNAVLWEYHNR